MLKKMIIIASSVLVIIVAAVIVLTWRTKDVKEAEAKIEAIGTVNEGSLVKIVEARAFFDGLKDTEKRKVRNRDLLNASEEAYDRLMAEKVDRLITDIGTVTLESREKIDRARKAYDALTRAQKAYVQSPELIDKAEVEYENCVLDAVADKIKAMENLTPENLGVIDGAEEAYYALSDAQRGKVEDRLGKTFRELLEEAKVRRVDVLIGEITYENFNLPTVSQYEEMLTALDYYFDLSVKNQAELQEKEKLDKAISQFRLYIKTRTLTDKWYIRQSFIEDCQEVSYEDLLDDSESRFGDRVSIRITVTEAGTSILQTGVYGVAEGTEEVVKLQDYRLKKNPAFTKDATYVIYGTASGTATLKTTEEGSGLFGTNLFGKKTEEKQIPVITVKYTDQDEIEEPDAETEKLFRELQIMAEQYGR